MRSQCGLVALEGFGLPAACSQRPDEIFPVDTGSGRVDEICERFGVDVVAPQKRITIATAAPPHSDSVCATNGTSRRASPRPARACACRARSRRRGYDSGDEAAKEPARQSAMTTMRMTMRRTMMIVVVEMTIVEEPPARLLSA